MKTQWFRKYWFRSFAALFAWTMLVSCSLLKVAVSTGDPLPKDEMNTRVMTRGFYYDMAAEVSRTADSIVVATRDVRVQVAAMRWKIHSTRAGVNASMQGNPDVALADLWILCHRMNDQFVALPDSVLFGEWTYLARETATNLNRRIAKVARDVLPSEKFSLMQRFVDGYVAENPTMDNANGTTNTTLAWMQFLKDEGVESQYTTGTIAEVLADVNDRLSGQTQQISNSISWSKDILQLQLQQDSIRTELGAQLDSLERNFNRMVVVAEHLPEISDQVLSEMTRQLTYLMESMNASVDNAFVGVDRQRLEMQHYITAEREAFTKELYQSADEILQTALDSVPGLVGKVLLYLILGLGVLIGVPFGVGFWLGGVRQRAKDRKEK